VHDCSVDVLAQLVRTSWTKSSRGGAPASRRNAAPVAFVLPALTPPLVHEVLMREQDGFVAQDSVQHVEPSSEDVSLTSTDDRLRVELMVTPFGNPRRWRRPPAVRLALGEWVRWQINYRFVESSSGDWTYRLDTLNLAYGQPSASLARPAGSEVEFRRAP
jgi:hypothetical protein